jgi:hypothetical protein
MMLKYRFTRAALNLILLALVLAAISFGLLRALTGSKAGNALPNFADFATQVQNGEADVLRGVYVPDVLGLPVA